MEMGMGMGLITSCKSKSKSKSEGYWGMGFLLVLFPNQENHHHNYEVTNNHKNNTTKPNNTSISLFNSSSSSLSSSSSSSLSSPLPSPLSSSFLKRTNNSAYHIHHLLHKAQPTISICLLLLFTTLLLFTLSTLPSTDTDTDTDTARHIYTVPRRHLIDGLSTSSTNYSNSSVQHALQGMGTLYRRGTRATPDLIVAHAAESLTSYDLKLFVRLLHRSGLTSRSDLLFIFPSKTADFDHAILRENESFMKLLLLTQHQKNNTGSDLTHSPKLIEKDENSGEQPIWGRRTTTRSDMNSSEEGDAESSTRPSYGSVVGFDVEELDPENSLSGFLDYVPMSLRRWACYPMLLGRVRRNFRHIMLVDVKEMLVLGDPLGRVRIQSPQTVLVKSAVQLSKQHGRKNLATRQKPAHPGFIAGGSRGVRRLSSAMLTDIVRASMQHKKKKRKNPVTESGLFNQLVENDFVLKNVNLIKSTESIPDLGSLVGSNPKTGALLFASNYTVIRRSNSNLSVASVVMKHTCSFPIDSTVYSDC